MAAKVCVLHGGGGRRGERGEGEGREGRGGGKGEEGGEGGGSDWYSHRWSNRTQALRVRQQQEV